jgi:hypothetical protein
MSAPAADLPCAVRLLCRLIPAPEREAIVGDLVEDAAYRRLDGGRRSLWLTVACGAIAGGFSAHRVRAWLVLPPVHEVVAGLAVDGREAFRGSAHPAAAMLRAVLFCGSVATLALGVEVLVRSLLLAAGL